MMMNATLSRLRDEGGMSVLEILVGVIILSATLLGLSAASLVAARQARISQQDLEIWAAVQEQVDSLMIVSYGEVMTGSAEVQGYPMTWTVSGTGPKKVVFVVGRTNLSGQPVADTLILYRAGPDS